MDLTGFSAHILGKAYQVKASASLKPQDRTPGEILEAIQASPSQAAEVFRAGNLTQISLDITGIDVKEGDVIPVVIVAHGTRGGKPIEAQATIQYSVLALPFRSGWYGGDGHIHTAWSPDVYLGVSIDDRAVYAVNNGFKWLIITDHQDGIDGNWSSAGGYVSQCNTVQAARGIPVCPGAEIATTNPPDEHALAYALSETAAAIPTNQALSPADLTKAINDHNVPYSYPVIAHPFGGYPWITWDSTTLQYVKAMELMTGEAVSSPSTITKWFELLRAYLPRKIGGGASIVGIGTSDCHNFQDPGYLGFTWAFTTAYGTGNRTAIWDAIRSGAVSASGRKDLGCFSVNSYAQGTLASEVWANPVFIDVP